MDSQFNDNNDYSKPNSIENTKNNDVCNDTAKISNGDELKTENYLDEFEKFLSKYTEQQRNCDNNTRTSHLNTINESVIENIIEMGIDIAETVNSNYCKPRQVDGNLNEVANNDFEAPAHDVNENLPINSTQDNIIKEETSQCMKTEVDLISLSSNEGINIDEREQNLDNLNNIFASTNENKSIEIEVDMKNEITDGDIISNTYFEAEFSEAGPSGFNYTNFDIDTIELCENSCINDMNAIIDLTDSPNNSPLKLKTIHTEENDMSNIENTSDFDDYDTKAIHILDNESDCSFHSSDFELITEDEAKMDGLIINFRQKSEINEENDYNNENIIEMCLPGPSNDYAYRENHRIPEGDEFFDMFHGFYAPANIPDLIFLENKSVVPSQCMNVESDTLGFDVAALNKEVFDEKYQEEAKETSKKILNSYHDVERKSRRRPL